MTKHKQDSRGRFVLNRIVTHWILYGAQEKEWHFFLAPMNSLFRIALLLFLSLLCVVRTQDYEADENDMEEDPLSIGGGTQQTCDACRTVMEQLLQEWHTIDNDSFLEAIEEASHKKEYVPVVPEEEVCVWVHCHRVVQAQGV